MIPRQQMVEWTDEIARSQRSRMDVEAVMPFLEGFCRQFRFRSFVTWRYDAKHDAWLLDGIDRWWDRPGLPAVPHEELARFNTLRLRSVLFYLIEAAAKRDELSWLTELAPGERDELLRRIRLGDLIT